MQEGWMTSRTRLSRAKCAMAVAIALGGGTVCNSCQTRLKDSFVGGTRSYFLSLFDPSAIQGLLADADGADDQ